MARNDLAFGHIFKQPQSRAETRSDITDRTVREIIKSESDLRAAKTAKLRQARLDHEESLADAGKTAKPSRGKSRKK